MTYHERKAKQLGLDLGDNEIRLLFYIWSSCPKGDYCNFMNDDTCFADMRFVLISQKLEANGYLDADPQDNVSMRLTNKGIDTIYALQS